MKIVKLKKRAFDTKARNKTKVNSSDIDGEIINCEAVLEYNDKPVAVYAKLDDDFLNDISWAVNSIKYVTDKRLGGLDTTSRIFGYAPRSPLRNDFCSITSMAKELPKQHYIVCSYAEKVANLYEKYLPELYDSHIKQVTESVLPCWTIPNSPFTSGIINKNNQLGYHYDTGNFKNVASNMISLKKSCKGGELILPEYNIGLECANGFISMFDGQSLFHGVSPFELGYKGYRYTLVYYALKAMAKCGTTTEEIDGFRKRRINIERKRARGEL